MSARSASATVRNPLLELEAAQALMALPAEQREPLARLLRELSTSAHARAEVSWRQRKGPMAAYWRAVGVYAKHTARLLGRAPAPAPLRGCPRAHFAYEPCPFAGCAIRGEALA